MSVDLELGKLRLSLTKSNLQLSLRATATFASPHHLKGSNSVPQFDVIDWNDIRQSWVQRGNGLRFDLIVRIDRQPLAEAQLSALGRLISSAEVKVLFIS
jgi:hypothetical protein